MPGTVCHSSLITVRVDEKIRKPNETQHGLALILLEITQLQVDKVLFPLGIV